MGTVARVSPEELLRRLEKGKPVVESGNARHSDSHPARVSAPNDVAARGLANLNLARVIPWPVS
jgi:hypothetical protein